jgi:hypothetical protein
LDVAAGLPAAAAAANPPAAGGGDNAARVADDGARRVRPRRAPEWMDAFAGAAAVGMNSPPVREPAPLSDSGSDDAEQSGEAEGEPELPDKSVGA